MDSIYESLGEIAGTTRDAIESFLSGIDLDSFYRGSSAPRYPGNDFLLDKFKRHFRSDLSYDATCWFHLTRAEEALAFEKGIVPLGQQLDSIFDWLSRLADGMISKRRWDHFRRAIAKKGSQIYQTKRQNSFYWGPYAILVKDLAFKPSEVCNHDYLSGPEIIEDICYCFQEIYEFNLLKIFLQKTKPCIVKFVDAGTHENYVRAGLWHLYQIIWKRRCSSYCNDCFDGKNVPVARSQILSIEFPEYPAPQDH